MNHHSIRLPLFPLIAGVMGACAVGVFIAMGLGRAFQWGQTGVLAVGELMALVSVLAGVGFGIAVLWLLAGHNPGNIAVGTVGAGITRMFASLALGLALYLAASPNGRAFWTAFLACSLLCLVAESAWGVIMNNRVNAKASPEDGAAS